MHRRSLTLAAAALLIAGCGSNSSNSSTSSHGSGKAHPQHKAVNPNAPEVNPAGDIPDNQVYVPYSLPGRHVSLKVPEGWARKTSGSATVFTDNLNSVTIQVAKAARAPTTTSVHVPNGGHAAIVHRRSGTGVVVKYLAKSAPDAVTGKTRTDAVERYLFFHNGRELVLTLSGPKGADNVDPWRLITESVTWR